MDDPLSKILAVFFFVFLNAFFVIAEFAIVMAPPAEIEKRASAGHRRARIARYVIGHMDSYLSGCQVGVTLASLALGWIGEPFVAQTLLPLFHLAGIGSEALLHTTSFVVAFTLITFLHIVLGEQAPKMFAIRRPLGAVLAVSPGLRLFHFVFYPFIALMNAASLLVLRLLGVRRGELGERVPSEAEIRSLISRSVENGELTRHETKMIERVFDFHDREAHQIMLPRTDIVFLSVESDAEENIRIAEKCGYTRFPLCEESVDRVIGFVHAKDLYRAVREAKNGTVDLRRLKRTILFFPEHSRLDTILREFQSRRVHLGIVLDEYGGTSGLLTLEDVIEELVGEIQDEFDRELPLVRRAGPNQFLVDGGCPVSEFEEATGVKLPLTGADTVAGVLLDTVGDLPDVGRRVAIGGNALIVESVEEQRITEVRLVRAAPEVGRGEGWG